MKREPAQSFEDLIVWQKSHQLTLRVYQLTAGFPRHELYGLTSQMRRAAVSVPSNIAEGFKKRGRAPDRQFRSGGRRRDSADPWSVHKEPTGFSLLTPDS
jgi:hypothetical protein